MIWLYNIDHFLLFKNLKKSINDVANNIVLYM